jgi:hypothetical protein
MESRYRLVVAAGSYEAHSLTGLLWEILCHRLWHFTHGDGWVD